MVARADLCAAIFQFVLTAFRSKENEIGRNAIKRAFQVFVRFF